MFFFLNDTATTEIYTLPLHDALPISHVRLRVLQQPVVARRIAIGLEEERGARPRGAVHVAFEPADLQDRKSTRLNSSHSQISYAVFCLKKKKRELRCIFTTTTCRTTC